MVYTKEQFDRDVKTYEQQMYGLGIFDSDVEVQKASFNSDGEMTQNVLCIVFSDGFLFRYAWQSEFQNEAFVADHYAERANMAHLDEYRNLAIACIGYINCENIYLQRMGGIPDKVSAKRERKGKSNLEPYYVCRIRGVQYDKVDPTQNGAKHSIRYDVRGHFRRLTTGKTTWVRPHQRGIENELYIPKTYLVDRKVTA